jgi:hypothetical protein
MTFWMTAVLDDRLVVAVYTRRARREETEGIER